MCIAMAGMLAPSVKTLPPHAWEAIFGLLMAWFAWRLVGDTKVNGLRSLVSGHRAARLFHCAAMVYMFAALTTSDGMDMTGMGSGMARSLKYPALALAFAFVLVCYSVWDGMREAEITRVDYDVRERSEYIGSPANEIRDGATEVRENLERGSVAGPQARRL
jgi:hypothetical protein